MKKIYREKKKNKKNKKNKILKMLKWDNIIMTKTRTPEKIEFPEGRVFFARFKRIMRDHFHLPGNIRMRRCYKESSTSR